MLGPQPYRVAPPELWLLRAIAIKVAWIKRGKRSYTTVTVGLKRSPYHPCDVTILLILILILDTIVIFVIERNREVSSIMIRGIFL